MLVPHPASVFLGCLFAFYLIVCLGFGGVRGKYLHYVENYLGTEVDEDGRIVYFFFSTFFCEFLEDFVICNCNFELKLCFPSSLMSRQGIGNGSFFVLLICAINGI
jgi:hypothetical protein